MAAAPAGGRLRPPHCLASDQSVLLLRIRQHRFDIKLRIEIAAGQLI